LLLRRGSIFLKICFFFHFFYAFKKIKKIYFLIYLQIKKKLLKQPQLILP
jgi:hypothetical protein